MYQALYRKYRPQFFSDVVGQEHITNTLKNSLSGGKTVHAYLFTGTRGTGKTTCAKILSKAINCLDPQNGEPCGKCDACKAIAEGTATDVVEIDAASNNSVDDIRNLREQVMFAPANAKFRVYIIDEVHMLSISAFNALLKTLEEPPEHAVFILATTEVHKLPATILSRCQRYDFRRIDSEKICERLQFVAKSEELSLSSEAATLIASAADGGMRDALSILDLCASSTKDITEDTVASVCSMAGSDYLIDLADRIKEQNTEAALLLIDTLHNSSVDMTRLAGELIRHFRDLMIIKTVKGEKKPLVCSKKRLELLCAQAEKFDIKEIIAILDILQTNLSLAQGENRRTALEMTVIRLCNPKIHSDIKSLELRIAALESGCAAKPVSQKTAVEPKTETLTEEIDEIPDITEENAPPAEQTLSAPEQKNTAQTGTQLTKIGENEWQEIIHIVQGTSPVIAGVLSGSEAYKDEKRIYIDSNNSQFINLINKSNTNYRQAIKSAAKQVLGGEWALGPYRKKQERPLGEDPLGSFIEKLNILENQGKE